MREFYRHDTLWIIIERQSTLDLEYFQETKKGVWVEQGERFKGEHQWGIGGMKGERWETGKQERGWQCRAESMAQGGILQRMFGKVIEKPTIL